MLIKSVRIRNFRSIKDACLACGPFTAVVGTNGSGKSSFLRGVELFYATSPKVDRDDYYACDVESPIIISITFEELSDPAKVQFAKYLQNDELNVDRVFRWEEGKVSHSYHGSFLQNPGFAGVRSATTAADRREKYEALRGHPEMATLPAWRNQGTTLENLSQWETEHPGQCERLMDNGNFFGFEEVGSGYLGRFSRFLLIPAVRDVSDDAREGKGTVLTQLLDLVIRSALSERTEIERLRTETQIRYEQILNPDQLPELNHLATDVTRTLSTFAPGTSVDLSWLPLDSITIPLPKAEVRLVEDGYRSAVNRTGHGLQRAFVLSLLQHLAKVQSAQRAIPAPAETEPEQASLPDFALAVEEPELYQHPSRQRHLSEIFRSLAAGTIPGVAEHTQVMLCTHSPLFVALDQSDSIQVLRKVPGANEFPKITTVVKADLESVANELWEANGSVGERYTKHSLIPRLKAASTPWMSEGFFADTVVLVEGEDDRAAILGAARLRGVNFEGKGISVIPCFGKSNMDRPFAIFRNLKIPVYPIWDGDRGKAESRPEENHRLLRLVSAEVEDWPRGVMATHAVFDVDLEETMKSELTEEFYESTLAEVQREFGIPKKKHATKNPLVVTELLKKAAAEHRQCGTIERMIDTILTLQR